MKKIVKGLGLCVLCSLLAGNGIVVNAASGGLADYIGRIQQFFTGSVFTESQELTEEGTCYHKKFGSYIVPKDWEENEEHSSADKFFYVKEGTGQEDRPNNIAVNEGKNHYAEAEHVQFREAILRQLSAQLAGSEGVTLNGNGSYTEKGYVLYTFEIKEENMTTIQFYIVGDYRYILVQESAFEKSDELDQAARMIVDSFQWREDME